VESGRKRCWYGLAVIVTIALGLASRQFRGALPEVLGKYPGDALWALMVFFGWGVVFPQASTVRIALLTLGVCVAIETLKLYQAPWIVGIRHTTLGIWCSPCLLLGKFYRLCGWNGCGYLCGSDLRPQIPEGLQLVAGG